MDAAIAAWEARGDPAAPFYLHNAQHMNGLPAGVLRLFLYDCAITTLAKFPAGLVELSIIDSAALESVENLPSSLRKLQISCFPFPSLGILPEALTHLCLTSKDGGCPLQELRLPPALKSLSIDWFAVRQLPPLPASVTTIRCYNCSSLISLGEALPPALVKLHLEGCTSLRALPRIPSTLKVLTLYNCTTVRKLPTLTRLEHMFCSNVVFELPLGLPASLQTLHIYGSSIASGRLPLLPEGLTSFRCPQDVRRLPDTDPPVQCLAAIFGMFSGFEDWWLQRVRQGHAEDRSHVRTCLPPAAMLYV